MVVLGLKGIVKFWEQKNYKESEYLLIFELFCSREAIVSPEAGWPHCKYLFM